MNSFIKIIITATSSGITTIIFLNIYKKYNFPYWIKKKLNINSKFKLILFVTLIFPCLNLLGNYLFKPTGLFIELVDGIWFGLLFSIINSINIKD